MYERSSLPQGHWTEVQSADVAGCRCAGRSECLAAFVTLIFPKELTSIYGQVEVSWTTQVAIIAQPFLKGFKVVLQGVCRGFSQHFAHPILHHRLIIGLLFLKCLLETTQTALGYVRTIHVWEFNMKEALVRLLELHVCSNFSTNYSVDGRIVGFGWQGTNASICLFVIVLVSIWTPLSFGSIALQNVSRFRSLFDCLL